MDNNFKFKARHLSIVQRSTQAISVWDKTMAIIIYNVYYMFMACLSQKWILDKG